MAGAYRGSFTKSGANEVIVFYGGCAPHSGGFGGSFVARQVGDTFQLVRNIPEGFYEADCQRIRLAGGLDGLVCQKHNDINGGGTFDFVELLRYAGETFAADDLEQTDDRLLGLISADCPEENAKRDRYAEIKRVRVADRNGDGLQDITIQTTIGRGIGVVRNGACRITAPHYYTWVFLQTKGGGVAFRAAPGNPVFAKGGRYAGWVMSATRVKVEKP